MSPRSSAARQCLRTNTRAQSLIAPSGNSYQDPG